MRWSSTEITGTRIGPGRRVGKQDAVAHRCTVLGSRSSARHGRSAAAQNAHSSSATSVGDSSIWWQMSAWRWDSTRWNKVRASRRASPARTAPLAWAARHGVLEDADEGVEDAPELVGMGLGQAQVLPHEGGGVGEATLDGEEPEQPDHHERAAARGDRLGVDHGRQQAAAPRRASSSNSATRSSSLPAKQR